MSRAAGPVIEVFADIWCPFAHVGLRAIEEQRARAGRSDVAIWVRAWPLELVNGAPLDPTVTWEHAEDLREQVAPNLFSHLDVDRFPTSTLEALALANRAYRTDVQLGEQVSFALRDALFEEGRDISDPVTLEYLADDLGMALPDETDRAAVIADWHEGRRRGVLDRRTSSVATPTCSAHRSTSPRTRSRGWRSCGTCRASRNSWNGAWSDRDPHEAGQSSPGPGIDTPGGIGYSGCSENDGELTWHES